MKIIVCQRGSRRRYMVPRLLEECGLLAALYTDSSACSLLGKLARRGAGLFPGGAIERLAKREIPGIPRSKIFSSDLLLWQKLRRKPLEMAEVYQKWGVAGVDAVYSFYGEDPAFLESAKSAGKRIIVDVMSHPFAQEIYRLDAEKYPDYGLDTDHFRREHEKQLEHSKRVFELADILIAPSNWVCEGILRVSEHYREKLHKIPYGCSIHYHGKQNTPQPGRLLFVGHGLFSKGLHHLAEILPELKSQYPDLECRVIGVSPQEGNVLKNAEEFNFVGNLPMDKMKDEYLEADILVVPSLSEGQSGAVLEALAGGVPVVLTHQAGVDIKHGREGFLFEAGDLNAMKQGISEIIGNRNLRNAMSQATLRFSETLSVENWKQNLYGLLKE